jgi:hypothetical protein
MIEMALSDIRVLDLTHSWSLLPHLYVVSESGTVRPSELMDTLKASALPLDAPARKQT